MTEANKLLLGLGNSLRGNDAIGFYVLDYVVQQDKCPPEVIVEKSHASGISLLSYLFQFNKIVIVDAIQIQYPTAARFWKIRAHDFECFRGSLRTSHGYSLRSLIELGEKIGWSPKKDIRLFLIGIPSLPVLSFDCNESISESLKQIIPSISSEIIRELNLI